MGIMRKDSEIPLFMQHPENCDNHRELCFRAGRWLLNNKQCHVVLVEKGCGSVKEMPDAIGWCGRESMLVEVKVSRSDFLTDKKKTFRHDGTGMGNYRYYMTPKGLLTKDDLPDKWGLVEVSKAGRTRIVLKAEQQETHEENEKSFMLAALQYPEKLFGFWWGYWFETLKKRFMKCEMPSDMENETWLVKRGVIRRIESWLGYYEDVSPCIWSKEYRKGHDDCAKEIHEHITEYLNVKKE